MNTRRLLLRIIASPFIFGMLFVTYQYRLARHFFKVMRWGGEWTTYEKETPADMTQILVELKKKNDK